MTKIILKTIKKNLEAQIKVYLMQIPENVTYSIIPALRRQDEKGDYKAISTSKSIKITRFNSC